MRQVIMLLCLLVSFQASAQDKAPSSSETPFPASARYEAAFVPGGAQELILKAINSARHEILVASYTFSNEPISEALLAAHKRGVSVRLVSDKKTNTKYTAAHFLAEKGVPVRLNGRYRIHHHKFMVIDKESVETGSFNYAKTAEKNAENVLMIWHTPDLARIYASEWEKMWGEGIALKGKP